jgi:hypothetical protein
MIAKLESLGKAEAAFQDMIGFVKSAIESQELRIDEVERGLFDKALALGLHLLESFVAGAGDGDCGLTIEHEGQSLQRSAEKMTKLYRSIFGVLSIPRYVYAPGAKKKVQWAPVDARLGRPAGEQSYVLEDWMLRVCVKESFAEGVGSLRDLLGVKTSVRAAEVMTRNLAAHADSFSDTQSAFDPSTERKKSSCSPPMAKACPCGVRWNSGCKSIRLRRLRNRPARLLPQIVKRPPHPRRNGSNGARNAAVNRWRTSARCIASRPL